MRKGGFLVFFLGCCLVAAGRFPPEALASQGTITIGVAGAHSGDLASYGLPTVKAVELVVNAANAAGGILGKQVELRIEDDVCKAEIATNTATKLISMHVDAVIGHICSGATKAVLGLYNDAGIVTISPSATNPALTANGDYPNFFRTIAPDDAQATKGVAFTLGVLKVKKIAVIHDKGDYGKGYAELAQKQIEADPRGELVLYEGVTPGAMDYSAIVQKIKRSGAEAVIYGGYHPEAAKIVTQMRRKRMKTYFVSDDGVKDETFIKVAGEAAEGVYATGPMDTTKNPLAIKAVQDLKRVYGEDPGAFFLNAYAASQCLLNAFTVAGSTDYDAVNKALRSSYVETPLGRISFDGKGDAIGVVFSIYEVKNGAYVEVK